MNVCAFLEIVHMTTTHNPELLNLIEKHRIHSGLSLSVVNAPKNYFSVIGMKASDFMPMNSPRTDFIHVFSLHRAQLLSQLPMAKRCLSPTGTLWISWPQNASATETDLDGGFVRGAALAQRLTMVDQADFDTHWLVYTFIHKAI